MFTEALFRGANIWKQPKWPSIHEWIIKWCIYTMKYDSAIKKNEIMSSATIWMDLKDSVLSEIKYKCHMISLMCEI